MRKNFSKKGITRVAAFCLCTILAGSAVLTGCGKSAGNKASDQAESQNSKTSDSGEETDSELLSMKTMKKIPDFTCKDMNGNEIANEVFSDYKLTLVNLWGTWCNPCVAEMPKLQQLYEKYYDKGLNIIGVTEDATGNEDLVQKIVDTHGVTYTILYPDDQFYDDFVSICFSFPTSLLVDSEGNVLRIFEGDPGFDALDSAINSILSQQ